MENGKKLYNLFDLSSFRIIRFCSPEKKRLNHHEQLHYWDWLPILVSLLLIIMMNFVSLKNNLNSQFVLHFFKNID